MQELQKKLSHSLFEIRQRALCSFRFKLNNNLLQISDFAQNEQFIKSLLQWFNCEEVRNEEDDLFILQVLHSLCVYSTHSKQLIVGIGGIKFLQDLRADFNYEIIDEILKLLLSTPMPQSARIVPTADSAAPRTNYSNQGTTTWDLNRQKITPLQQQPRTENAAPLRPVVAERVVPVHDIPRIQKSINLPFEYIHLSHADEKFVSDFINIIHKSKDQVGLYEKYVWGLDVLCADFGPQLFLQKTTILTTILDDLYYNPTHHHFTVSAVLQKIVSSWSRAFRKAASSFHSFSAVTYTNNTPDASYSASNVADILSFPKEDAQFSLPYAAHIIFDALTDHQQLSQVTDNLAPLLNSMLTIVYGLSPFLLLYLESISAGVEGNVDISTFKNGILYYCQKIIGLSRFSHEGDSELDSALFAAISCVISFSVNTSLEIPPDFVTEIISEAIDAYDYHPLLEHLVNSIFKDNTDSMSLIYRLLQSDSEKIRSQVVKKLIDQTKISSRSKTSPEDEVFQNPELFFQILFAASIEEEEQIQNDFLTLIHNFIPRLKLLPSVRGCLIFLQALQNADQGACLNAYIKYNSKLLDEADYLGLTLRGLFHKDASYRDHCESILIEILNHSGNPTSEGELRDAFIFSAQDVSAFADIAVKSAPRLDTLNVDAILADLDSDETDNAVELLEMLYWVVRNDEMRAYFVSIGGLASILNHIRRCSHSKQSSNKRALIMCFRCLRSCVGVYGDIAVELAWKADFLLNLATRKLIVSQTYSSDFVFRSLSQIGRQEVDFNGDTIVFPRERTGLDNIQGSQKHPIIPIRWLSSFNLVGSFSRIVKIASSSSDVAQVSKNLFAKIEQSILEKNLQLISSALGDLKSASNHTEFMGALYHFESILASPQVMIESPTKDLLAALSRFILTLPACSDDSVLLDRLLQISGRMMGFDVLGTHGWRTMTRAVTDTVIPLLQGDLAILDTAQNIYQPAVSSCLLFLQKFVEKSPKDSFTSVLKQSPVVEILRQVCLKCFSAKQSGVIDREKRISCLRVIAGLSSKAVLIEFSNASQLADLTAVIIHTIGCLQQSFGSHDNFTYPNRSVYRLSVVCVKNMSRLLVDLRGTGPKHWLFEGSLDWLVHLLSDDEIALYALGLGIISNLILLGETFEIIISKIPDYIDMAFSIALDFDRPEALRKEAFRILAHQVVRHYQYHPPAHDTDEGIFNMLDKCLFFDRIHDAYDFKRLLLGDPSTASLLLKNLAAADPARLASKVMEHGIMDVLFSFLIPDHEIETVIMREFGNEVFLSFDIFRIAQFWKLQGGLIRDSQAYILNTFTSLSRKSADFRKAAIQSNFLSKVFSLLRDSGKSRLTPLSAGGVASVLRDFRAEIIERHTDDLKDLGDDLLFNLLRLLSHNAQNEVDWKPYVSLFSQLLSLKTSVGGGKVEIVQEGVSSKDFAKLFQLVIESAVDEMVQECFQFLHYFLAMMPDLAPICAEFFETSTFKYENILQNTKATKVPSHLLQETLSLTKFGLNYLTTHAAKNFKLTETFYHVLQMLLTELVNPLQFDENLPRTLELLVAMNTLDAAPGKQQLLMLKPFKAGNRNASGTQGITFISIILNLIETCRAEPTVERGHLFNLCVRFIGINAISHEEISSNLIKSNQVARLCDIKPSLLKVKHKLFVHPVLMFVIQSSKRDELLHACSSVRNLHADLIHCLSFYLSGKKNRESLFLTICAIRAVASIKEARVNYLADGKIILETFNIANFWNSIERVLSQYCTDDCELLDSVTSMIWVFLYDNQKSKAAIRKTQIPNLISQIESKTHQKPANVEMIEQLLR